MGNYKTAACRQPYLPATLKASCNNKKFARLQACARAVAEKCSRNRVTGKDLQQLDNCKDANTDPVLQPEYAVFLHIQKTAGTSIVNTARRYYGEITSHGDCWGHRPEEFNDVRFVSGHIGYDFVKSLIPSRYSFVFLRNPVERVLSLYYFCRTRDPDEFPIYGKASELDLEGFLKAGFTDPVVRNNIWNNQVWQLAHGYANLDKRQINDFEPGHLLELATAHLEQFSYIGFTETFAEDRIAVLKGLGLPLTEECDVVNSNPGRPTAKDFSSNALKLLGQLTHLDQLLYDKAIALHNKQG